METLAVGSVDEQSHAVEDEALAATCTTTTVLITAGSAAAVEHLARRIHAASARAASPFTVVAAAGLSSDRAILTQTCRTLLDKVGCGSLLITDVEHMPVFVQSCLIETFAGLQSAREAAGSMCLMAGTTTILHDRIADGTFSERLFYRLNTIHVVRTEEHSHKSRDYEG
jgi:DNA-binding NtrC family response regulator